MLPINRTTITIGILVILLAAIGIQTVRASRYKIKATLAENERDQALKFSDGLISTVTEYENKNGQLITKTEVLELSLNNLQKLRENERLKFLKDFDNLKRDLRNLESAGSFEWLLSEDSVPFSVVTIPCTDSLKVFKYELMDEFNTIKALVVDTPQVEIRVPFKIAILWERGKKFLWWKVGKKQYSIEGYSPNKLPKITKLELIKVEKK